MKQARSRRHLAVQAPSCRRRPGSERNEQARPAGATAQRQSVNWPLRREAIGHAAGTKEQACLVRVLAGPVDLAAGLGVWVVGLGGLEPPTSSLSGMRSNRLSYRPGSLAPRADARSRWGTPTGKVTASGRATGQSVSLSVTSIPPPRWVTRL